MKISLLIVVVAVLYGCNFAPGSFPYAEEFELNESRQTLINKVENFKEDNPQYKVPIRANLIDGYQGDNLMWFHVYFYYPDEDVIVKTWLRSKFDSSKTTFALVGINKGLVLGNWKEVNHNLDHSENSRQIGLFKERILNRLQVEN